MRKINIFAIILLIPVLSISLISAVEVSSFAWGESAKIEELKQFNYIDNNNLYSSTEIVGIILNGTIAKYPQAYFQLDLRPFEQEHSFKAENVEVEVYNEWCPVNGDYKKIDFDECGNTLPFNRTIMEDGEMIRILFNLSEVTKIRFSIKIDYKISNFLMTNGNYQIAWLKTNCGGCKFQRTLMLPSSSSVIESWNNFDIVRNLNGKWVLEVSNKEGETGIKNSMVWFRDVEKEKTSLISWEYSLILIGLGFTIILSILQLYLHKSNLLNNWGWFIFASGCLLAGFGGVNNNLSLMIVGFILFVVGAIMYSLTWNKSEDTKLKELLEGSSFIKGMGKHSIKKLKNYFRQN